MQREMENEKRKAEKKELMEGLNVYYSLKSQYEDALKKEKNKILKNKDLSKREKQKEFKKLKPKCLNCKRAVGTVFSSAYDEKEDGRKLRAYCGDKSSPCDLNVDINVGKIILLEEFLEIDQKDISNLKIEIIKDKNDLIFGYITTEQALESFNTQKENLTNYTTSYELGLEKLVNIVNNKEKNEELNKLEKDIYENIFHIRDTLKKKTTRETIRDVVFYQVNELLPKVEKLRNEKYSYCEIEFSEDSNDIHLIEKEVSVDQIEENYSENKVGVLSRVA